MAKHFNICTLYFLLCILMALNGVLYPGSGIVSQSIQFIFIIISIYYAIFANQHYQLPVYFKALNVLLIMFTIYGVILIVSGERLMVMKTYYEVSNTGFLKNIFKSLLPIYAFYVFSRKGLLKEENARFWFFIFLLLAIRSFFGAQRAALLRAEERGSTAEETTINAAYTFVGLLPGLVLFYKRPVMQYVLLAVCAFFIIFGMKRGAIFSGFAATVWFLYYNLKVKRVKRKRKFVVFLVSVFVVAAISYFVDYMLRTSDYFNYRIAQTELAGSSGRDELYSTFFQHFVNEQNLIVFLLGNGANATLKISENFAHNDWLEIAINQGVLGLTIYFVYWLSFYKSWYRSRNNNYAYMALGMVFIVYFMATLFSMSYNSVSRCSAMVLGYYMASGCLSKTS